MALTTPTVPMLSAAASAASSGEVPVPAPIAAPMEATSAVRKTVVPIAVKHPENAEPNLNPPNSAFSRWWMSSRRLAAAPAGRPRGADFWAIVSRVARGWRGSLWAAVSSS